jgi:hypothetical protein
MDNGRRHQHAAPAASGIRLLGYFEAFVAAVSLGGATVPGRSRNPRAHTSRPGRQLSGAARQWRGRWVWHQQRPCRSLAITVEPLDELTATQRRQLQDEVDLVGAVMEATPTLTVGTVTVGPHG